MGGTQSSQHVQPAHPPFGGSGVAACGLSERDAWTIAIAWREQLAGCVTLEIYRDTENPSIIKSYAWVTIWLWRMVSQNQRTDTRHEVEIATQQACIARAAAVTWLALASCRGFGGRENPVFWKLIFSELVRPTDTPGGLKGSRDRPSKSEKFPSVSEAIGFFDQNDVAFPRFRVDVSCIHCCGSMDSSLRAFCGVAGSQDGFMAGVEQQLDSLLAELDPFMYVEHAKLMNVDVCVSTLADSVDGFYTRLRDQVHAINTSKVNSPRSIKEIPFRISEVRLRDVTVIRSDANAAEFARLLQSGPLRIGQLTLKISSAVSRKSSARVWQSVVGLSGSNSLSKTTTLVFKEPCSRADQVFSALPFAHTLRSVKVTTQRASTHDAVDSAWMAYAIFHPCSSQSSWQHLELGNQYLTPQMEFALHAMARGNNLLELLNGTPPASSGYGSAWLLSETIVYDKCDGAAAVELLVVPEKHTLKVYLCGIASIDKGTWGEWVAVVVPARGLGWVRAAQVVDVHCQPGSRSGISSLLLCRPLGREANGISDQPSRLLHVLRPMGASLKRLNIGSARDVPTVLLSEILALCPLLAALTVSVFPEFWDACESMTGAPLQELELWVPASADQRLTRPPPVDCVISSPMFTRLEAMIIRTWAPRILEANQSTIHRILTHVGYLRYFHWCEAGAEERRQSDPRRPVAFRTSLMWTPYKLCQLPGPVDGYLQMRATLAASCAAAFVSVLIAKQHTGDASIAHWGRMDRGVLVLVFQFAKSPAKRQVFVDSDAV